MKQIHLRTSHVGNSLDVHWLERCFHCEDHEFDPWPGNQDPTR